MEPVSIKYANLCPGCGGMASDRELLEHGLCNRCFKKGRCNALPWLCDLESSVSEFERFFEERVGRPTKLQRLWATRFFMGLSLPLSAPTGLGKTTFALALASYLSTKREKSYMIFPTRALVMQAVERLESFGCRDVAYYPGSSKEDIFSGSFLVLVTTSAFFHRNFESIPKGIYSMVFVDDADSFMKSRRNAERLSSVAGGGGTRILMASATAKPRPGASRVLIEKAGMKPSRNFHPARKIIDCEAEMEWRGNREGFTSLAEMIREMRKSGKAGLVFTGSRNDAEITVKELSSLGIDALLYDNLGEFREHGDVAIGIARPNNPLVRGIDMPERIGFAIFTTVPRFEIRADEISEGNAKLLSAVLSPMFPHLRRFSGTRLVERLREILSSKDALNEINSSPYISFRDGAVVFADTTTYLQASGRVSRMNGGFIHTGLSVVIPDDAKAMSFLKRQMKWMHGIEFRKGWKEYVNEIGKKERISPRHLLVIVESPTKAKTIASFFSRPGVVLGDGIAENVAGYLDISFGIVASRGHVTDLSTINTFGLEGNTPIFEIIGGKEKVVDWLRKFSISSDVVIATDPDREGEKIAYDIYSALSGFPATMSRIEFHEITKSAFLSAISSPREIDRNMVGSQLVRRVADRLIGFSASMDLQEKFGRKVLSAGRVQTPVLGWIIKRWKESRESIDVVSFSIPSEEGVEIQFSIELGGLNAPEKADARVDVSESERVLGREPLDTESMLRLSSSLFPPEKTMSLAQSLFEKGLITYHRTDSKRVSERGMEVAREYIERVFGKEFFRPNRGTGEGAHECIRPTRPFSPSEASVVYSLTRDESILYSIIFRNFIASQMKPVKLLVSRVAVEIDGIGKAEKEVVSGVLEHGWDLEIPVKAVGRIRKGIYTVELQRRKRRKAYPMTYAEVVGMMKERGIGRPSTYAITIEKLKQRRYVVEAGKRRKVLVPTKLGISVFDYLMGGKWARWLSEEYTAKLEKEMDMVEKGERHWKDVVAGIAKEIVQ